MSPNGKLCWREVTYPLRGYVVAPLVFYPSRQKVYPMPMTHFITTLNDVTSYLDRLETEMASMSLVLTEEVLVQQLTFERSYLLHSTHWGAAGEIQPDFIDRMAIYYDVFTQPDFYRILVTPDGLSPQGTETFTVDMPFLLTATNHDIDRYIRNSNLPVDETARYAAFYTASEVMAFNRETNKLIAAERLPFHSN